MCFFPRLLLAALLGRFRSWEPKAVFPCLVGQGIFRVCEWVCWTWKNACEIWVPCCFLRDAVPSLFFCCWPPIKKMPKRKRKKWRFFSNADVRWVLFWKKWPHKQSCFSKKLDCWRRWNSCSCCFQVLSSFTRRLQFVAPFQDFRLTIQSRVSSILTKVIESTGFIGSINSSIAVWFCHSKKSIYARHCVPIYLSIHLFVYLSIDLSMYDGSFYGG